MTVFIAEAEVQKELNEVPDIEKHDADAGRAVEATTGGTREEC